VPRWLFAPLILVACTSQQDSSTLKELPADVTPRAVRATFVTRPLISTKINGAALYHGSDGMHWIIATTTNDVLVVFDAVTGDSIRTVGARGTGMGELRGPAGIVVPGDSIALVVERDNGRVQGFHLPDFKSVGTFGDRLIGTPDAITAYLAGNAWAVYIAHSTDAKSARVSQFRLTVGDGELIAIHWRTFGDTAGNGVISSSGAVAADHNRLLVPGPESGESVYDIDGRFTRRVVSNGAGDPGAAALYACNDKRGYWITTERRDSLNVFHILDRDSFVRLGVFTGMEGRIDRILTVSPAAYAWFPGGVVVARNGNGSFAAISWRDIASALQLRPDCKGG
jgi:3-phytase